MLYLSLPENNGKDYVKKQIITSCKMPVAGPYSPAVEAEGFIFISGQLPLNPETGDVIIDIKAGTRQVLTNLQAILEECGLTLDHVIKTTIYLQNMADFAVVNEIYASFFPKDPPARSILGVSALPKNVPLEIEAVAVRK
jgi:2-iminobutanoate/2-iminopropanoate deaminase